MKKMLFPATSLIGLTLIAGKIFSFHNVSWSLIITYIVGYLVFWIIIMPAIALFATLPSHPQNSGDETSACPECGGNGDADKGWSADAPCARCGGRGRIKRQERA